MINSEINRILFCLVIEKMLLKFLNLKILNTKMLNKKKPVQTIKVTFSKCLIF